MLKIISYVITLIIVAKGTVLGQNTEFDSLLRAIKTAKFDTTKLSLYYKITEACEESDIEKYAKPAINLVDNLLKNEEDINVKKVLLLRKAQITNNYALYFSFQGNINQAFFYNKVSLKLSQEINDVAGIATSYNNIGVLYNDQSNVAKALENYKKALIMYEKNKDMDGIGTVLNNIGTVFKDQGDYANSFDYYSKSLKIHKEINDSSGMALCYSNIGFNYDQQKDSEKAFIYYKISLKIYESLNNKNGIASTLSKIGSILLKLGDLKNAYANFYESYIINKEAHNTRGIITSQLFIGDYYYTIQNYKKSILHADSALAISKTIGDAELIASSENLLSNNYLKQKKVLDAFNHYKQYIIFKDSILNENTRNASIKSQLNYEFEKKTAEDSIRVAEEKKITTIKLKQEKNQRYFLYGGLSLTVLFAIFMVNRFRVTNRQKIIIQKQKQLVDEKQKEILGSIHYAKRIQQSLLPTEKFIDRVLKNNKN